VKVEFVLKTDSGYPKDTGVTLFTLPTPGNPLRYNTHLSAPPVSALTHSFLRPFQVCVCVMCVALFY